MDCAVHSCDQEFLRNAKNAQRHWQETRTQSIATNLNFLDQAPGRRSIWRSALVKPDNEVLAVVSDRHTGNGIETE